MIGTIIDLVMDVSGLRKKAQDFGSRMGESMLEKNQANKSAPDENDERDKFDSTKQVSHKKKRKTKTSCSEIIAIVSVIVVCTICLIVLFAASSKKSKSSKTMEASSGSAYKKGTLIDANGPGEPVNLESLLPENGTSILYFHSNYCPHCLTFLRLLNMLAVRKPELLIFKIELDRPGAKDIDFHSPVGEEFDVHSVPRFIVYEGKKERARDAEAKQMVKNWMIETNVAR